MGKRLRSATTLCCCVFLQSSYRKSHQFLTELYAQMVDDAVGLEKIKKLQSHDNNEIYDKATKILELYWTEEDDEIAAPLIYNNVIRRAEYSIV